MKSKFLLLRCLSNGLHAFYSPFLFSNSLKKSHYIFFLLCYKHRNGLALSTFQNSYNNVSPFSSNGSSLSFLLVIDFLLNLLLLCFLINSLSYSNHFRAYKLFFFHLTGIRSPQQNNSFKCKKKSLSALLQSPLLIATLLFASYLTLYG